VSPILSVVIPNRNGQDLLRGCLQSLQEQSLSDLEVIVVDDASSDGSVGMVREEFSSVEVIPLRSNVGFAGAANAGIAQVKGEFVALLNNDAIPDIGWAAALAGYLQAHGEVGFCASKVIFHAAPDVVDSCGDCYAREGVAGKIGHLAPASGFTEPGEVFGASAVAAIYRRELLRELDGFDEDFFLIHEDTDLSFRARLMGYSCHFVPEAIVRHRVGSTIGRTSPLAVFYASRNQEFVFLKDMPDPLLRKYLALHLFANGLQLGTHATRGRAASWLRGKREAVASLPEVLEKRKQVQRTTRTAVDSIDRMLLRAWVADAIRRNRASRRRLPIDATR
jgi:GT2 family glycosyltransferase